MRLPEFKAVAVSLAAIALWGCKGPEPPAAAKPASVSLEVFAVSPAAEGETVRYVRRITEFSNGARDPDSVARELVSGIASPAILHSTSWRWEKDRTIVLTYLAYCEDGQFHAAEPVRLPWSRLAPPPTTDPQRPRPAEIREVDVIAHGLRHLSFLVRYARDGRMAEALSPRSLAFFATMCGQLAGRLDAARQFEACAAVGAR
jgi:hypothetical protein